MPDCSWQCVHPLKFIRHQPPAGCARCCSALVSLDPYRNLVRWWGHGGRSDGSISCEGGLVFRSGRVGGDRHCISGEESPCGLTRDCSRETRTGLTLNHPPAILPSLLCKGLDFFSSETSEVLLLAGLVSREATAPVGRLLCSGFTQSAFPNTHPAFPQHGLRRRAFAQGIDGAVSTMMSQNFCPLHLQPIKHSWRAELRLYCFQQVKGRLRYRTKALSSRWMRAFLELSR